MSRSNFSPAADRSIFEPIRKAGHHSRPVAGAEGVAGELAIERRRAGNRRNNDWYSFLFGNFRPRRRDSRRQSDQHQFLFDWHEPRVLYLALAVLLLSCIDALFTLNLLSIGATEANAVMVAFLERGVDSFVSGKIWMTSLSLIVLVAAARRKFIGSLSVEHLLQFICAGYFIVICYEIYLFGFVFDLKLFS